MSGLLIVGSSQAGVQLAASLRTLGHDGPITLLGDEPHRPYQRPPLSKDFLAGKVSKESVLFRTDEYWREHRIDLLIGQRVVRLDHRPDGSGAAHLRSGGELAYDRLALCTGARARRLPTPGADRPGVLYLRTADDALELTARLPRVRDVVVIGGGFIGVEAAAALAKLGRRVTLLEAGTRLMERALGAPTSALALAHHLEAGIDIRLGACVTAIVGDGDGDVRGVVVDGERVPADVVLIGVGVVPNTELAASIGLRCDDGIVVDERALASDRHTLAVGDVARMPDPSPGAEPGRLIRLESVHNAVEQAKVAAHVVAGRAQEYRSVPWFWSDQGGLKIQIAGLSAGHDQVVVRHDTARRKFSALYYRAGRLLAAEAVNTPLDFMAAKAALASGAHIPPAVAADATVPLKQLVVAA
jgi:3-phenylpropionate/trans-cinnamate dioxygenase ferredoxin reductase subunit